MGGTVGLPYGVEFEDVELSYKSQDRSFTGNNGNECAMGEAVVGSASSILARSSGR